MENITIKVTIENDGEEEDFFYEKVVTPDQYEDIKANLEVLFDQYDDAEDEEDLEEEEEVDEADLSSDPPPAEPTSLTDPRD